MGFGGYDPKSDDFKEDVKTMQEYKDLLKFEKDVLGRLISETHVAYENYRTGKGDLTTTMSILHHNREDISLTITRRYETVRNISDLEQLEKNPHKKIDTPYFSYKS